MKQNMTMQQNSKYSLTETEGQFDIELYARMLGRNLWIILLLAFLGVTLGTYLAIKTDPVYNATAKILADPFQDNLDRDERAFASSMAALFFETQYEIIRSRAIAEKVVDNLELVKEARAAQEDQQSPPQIGIVKDIKDFVKDTKDFIKQSLGGELEEYIPLTDSELRILIANNIAGDIRVTGGRQNQFININYQSTDPQLAADIINAVSSAYIEFGLTNRLNEVKTRQGWLSTQYVQLKKNLEASEQRVKEFRDSRGLIDSVQQRDMADTQLQSLNTNLVDAQTELSIKSEEHALVQEINNGSKDFSSFALVMQNTAIGTIVQNASSAQNIVDELSDRYGEKHPKMISARTELRSATRNLRQEVAKVIEQIENQYRFAKIQVDNINKLIDKTKADVQGLQEENFALISLEREVENNRGIYESFQSRLLEANVRGEITASNVYIVDKATVPKVPISPNVKKIILVSGMAGAFLGGLIAFAREFSNNTFTTPDLLEEKLKLPVLGLTPRIQTKGTAAPEKQYLDDTLSPFSESINTIRTGLLFSNIDHPPKTLLVTSATGSEGKSTLAINIAASFSQLGKTLLLEVDLRKPSAAINLGIENKLGLTDLIGGTVTSANDVFFKTNDEKLSVITCGTIARNPLELLSSKKFDRLLESLKSHFDYIIMDGPPTLPISDACILANKVDGVIFAVKAEDTRIKVAKEAVSRLHKLNANVIGAVLTVADPDKLKYYGAHYYSGEYYGVRTETTIKPDVAKV
ncbi:MAG: capsular exopolysaccharide synthesis family protein [Alphaproteobacteria bacterium]|jgi:capsular exopolysaccharide synthesis family protein